jgi:hypothetical protein
MPVETKGDVFGAPQERNISRRGKNDKVPIAFGSDAIAE